MSCSYPECNNDYGGACLYETISELREQLSGANARAVANNAMRLTLEARLEQIRHCEPRLSELEILVAQAYRAFIRDKPLVNWAEWERRARVALPVLKNADEARNATPQRNVSK